MSNVRKIKKEIELTYKKVAEGFEIFDDLWDKIYGTDDQRQQIKIAQELKRELKKLQRCRDNIKTWIANAQLKVDKTKLAETRRSIEVKMEKFKVCEQEVKTKTYSKEGLKEQAEAAAKTLKDKQSKIDKETSACMEWVQDATEQLQEQIETLEEEIDEIQSSKMKKSKKEEKIDELEEKVETHRSHTENLESIYDHLKAGELDPAEVDLIRDDVEYYIESNNDPDFFPNDEMYDDINLDDVDAMKERKRKKDEAKKEKERKAEVARMEAERLKVAAEISSAKEREMKKKASKKTKADVPNAKSNASKRANSDNKKTTSATSETGKQPKNASASASNDANRNKRSSRQQKQSLDNKKTDATQRTVTKAQRAGSASSSVSNERRLPEREERVGSVINSFLGNTSMSRGSKGATTQAVRAILNTGNKTSEVASKRADPGVMSIEELSISFEHVPHPTDSTRQHSERYAPTRPCPFKLSDAFPTRPLRTLVGAGGDTDSKDGTTSGGGENVNALTAQLFSKFDTDTLFFIFYHQPGTYQQFLAARELKKKSWRFHKKYRTWFQRHEEPKRTTEQFEQGTYVYFDYETGWYKRIKSEFTFEYSFLEDSLSA